MSPLNYYKKALLENYANFSGRARRSEYWYFVLVHFLISIVLAALPAVLDMPILSLWSMVYAFAVIIPTLALTIRRLHDVNKDWYWIFLALVPIVGGIVLTVFFVQDSHHGENQWGPNPKGIGNVNGTNASDHLIQG